MAQSQFLIETQVKSSLNFSLTTAVSNLQRNLLMAREMTLANGLISGLATNYYVAYPGQVTSSKAMGIIANVFEDGCSCSNAGGCLRPAIISGSINEKTINSTKVPGIMFNCLPMDGTLASTFECYYDTDCLSLIQQYLSINDTLQPLNVSSRFFYNVTIKTLVDELMIENLTVKPLFSLYYNVCHPNYCTYSFSRRFDIIYTITLIFTAVGGISAALRFISLLIIKVLCKIRQRSIRPNNEQSFVCHPRILGIRLCTLLNKAKDLLINLNLFKSLSRDPEVIHRQCIITRIFIVCLGTSLIIFSFYTFLSIQTKAITIPNPSRTDYEYLSELYPDTLQCSCSQIAISYSSFMKMVHTFHQLCSSRLTSSDWYNRLYKSNDTVGYNRNRFSYTFASQYFQALDACCSLSENTINNAYRLFSANMFVSNRVLSERIFSKQMNAAIDTFKIATRAEFSRIFAFFRNNTQTGQFSTRTNSNMQFSLTPNGGVLMTIATLPVMSSDLPAGYLFICSCLSQSNRCGTQAFVYGSSAGLSTIYLKDLIIRCLPTETAIKSTLECWYDPICYDIVYKSFLINGVDLNNSIPLNANLTSRFSINASVQMIVDELLLENWTLSASYDDFYKQCAPTSCIYTIQQRFDWFLVFINLLGIYSGLSRGLRLILPIIIHLFLIIIRSIRARNHRTKPSTSNSQEIQFHNIPASRLSWLSKIKQYLCTLNLFQRPSSTTETYPQEIISTRLYLILLISITIILVLYTGLIEQTKSKTISFPSQFTYEQLQRHYASTLQCPCSNISILYNNFVVNINVTYHPICSSGFITDKWINFFGLYVLNSAWWLQNIDFRAWGIIYFRLLQSLCSLADSTVADGIGQFYASAFISTTAMSTSQFQVQIDGTLELFQNSILTLFTRPLEMFRAIAQGNALISTLGSNWKPIVGRNSIGSSLVNVPVIYNNQSCSCATTSSCFDSAGFYNNSHTKLYTIKGIVLGCLCLESILLSSLSCFYSNSCIFEMINATLLGNPSKPTKLPNFNYSIIPPLKLSSLNSTYQTDDTIETLVSRLFVDTWLSETSYERYYNACTPIYCIYSYERRLNVLYALTIFLGVFSGLSLGLRFIIPRIVNLLYKCCIRCRNSKTRPQ
ncbi:unnamed protein product [Adineta ricciae]|uniref:Uncharacterized protein n=1 Tax=Adineta ricciae TaxID=249248 RepID=A0A814YKH8_ADIRI|nr:unnamed protein product [Adineta ricciae]